MSKLSIQLFVLHTVLIVLIVPHAKAQTRNLPPAQQTQQTQQEEYSESALRRFEIITLSSLPFTAVHSYLVVRGIKMYRENQFAPELAPQDYRIISIGAASLSLFIGLWDWLHTRNIDRSAPRVPERKPPPPSEEEVPVEGSIAQLSSFGTRASRYRISTYMGPPLQAPVSTGLNRWASEPAPGLAISLLQIRF